MLKSGFTHRFNGEPIPPRSALYTAKQITPDAERTKKAAAFKAHAYNSIHIATQAESDESKRKAGRRINHI